MPDTTETAPVTPTETTEAPVSTEVTTETAPLTETTETKKDNSIPLQRFNEVYADKKRLERLLEQISAGQKKEDRREEPKTEEPPNPSEYVGREAEYYAALGAFSGRQEAKRIIAAERASQNQHKAQEDAGKAATNYKTKVGAEVAKDPSLAVDLSHLDSIVWPADTALLLEGHEHAGLLAKHMARNLQEAHELAHLAQSNPIAAAMKIGELGARLQGSVQPPKTPQTTKAPAPIDALKGGGKTTPGYTPGESSVSDYIKTYYPPPGN